MQLISDKHMCRNYMFDYKNRPCQL